MRQENERKDHGECRQNSGKTNTDGGTETWALQKAQEKKFEVAEMRMLRWMCGVTKLDKIRSEIIRGTTTVRETTKKVQEIRLTW